MNLKIRYFLFSTGSFFISSLTIFAMPLVPREIDALASAITAFVFWLFFIAGVTFTLLLAKWSGYEKAKEKVI